MSGPVAGVRQWVKGVVSPHTLVRLRCVLGGLPLPRWGNLRRVTPFSDRFGAERGTAIDRYYLHRFFERERALITGRVLEIQSSGYTWKYGLKVTAADSIDLDGGNAPTYVCDLARADQVLPEGGYDCFLLPNTLHHLRDIDESLRQAVRLVRPGGVVLASAAGFVPMTPALKDYWRSTADGWRELTARVWAGHDVQVEAHGNCLAAVAAMMGLAHEELHPDELEAHDPRYPVLITIRCRRHD